MATALVDLYPDIRIETPGIAEPLLALAVRESVQEFCRESEVWKYTVPDALDWTTALTFPTLTAGTDIPTATRVKRVDTVKYSSGTNYQEVAFMTRDKLDLEVPDWEVRTGSTPRVWTHDDAGSPRIVPIAAEDVASSLRLRVVLVPTDALTDLPEFLYEEFKDVLKSGAKARLFAQPGRDWTNTQLAAFYKNDFRQKTIKAKSRAEAGYGQPNRVVTYGGI